MSSREHTDNAAAAGDGARELIAHWDSNDTWLNPGATLEELAGAEFSLGFKLPSDFRALYQWSNGMVDDTSDELLFSLWSLRVILAARVEGRGQVQGEASLVPFADYLIDSHYYAIQLAGPAVGEVYLVASGARHHLVAASFAEFLDRLWKDPLSLWILP